MAEPDSAPHPWVLETEHLSGDWAGLRTVWADQGVEFRLFYNQLYGGKSSGGFRAPSGNAASGSFDLFGLFDFGKMGWIPGGEALFLAKSTWGDQVNPEVGSLGDPFDDADGHQPISIAMLHYQQSFLERKIQVRAGYLDLQTVLDRNAYANAEDLQFMNAFLDNNNAVIPLTGGPGVAAFVQPHERIHLVFAAADADARPLRASFDTLFDAQHDFNLYWETEIQTRIRHGGRDLPGNHRFGAVFDPKARPVWGGDGTDPSNMRFYLSGDQQIYQEPLAFGDQGLGIFWRYGKNDGDLSFGNNPTEHFWSCGALYTGLFPGRDADACGLATYSAIPSDERRRHHPGDEDLATETGWEWFYRCQLTPAMAVSPGVQYLRHPGARASREDVWIFGLRSRWAF
jgi:carbohydrate-selective porin OprB